MNQTEKILKKSPLYPILILETFFYEKRRRILTNITKYIVISLPIIIILSALFIDNNQLIQGEIDLLTRKLIGIGVLSLSIFLIMRLFEAYFASAFYFEHIGLNRYNPNEFYTFSAGRILKKVKNDNLFLGFLLSDTIGQRIMLRLGFSPIEILDLIKKQKNNFKSQNYLELDNIKLLKVIDLANFLYNNYFDFKKALNEKGLSDKDLEQAVNWVIYEIEDREYQKQWWRPERLARIPGVGTDWSFGRTYLLSKFSRNLLYDQEVNSNAVSFEGRARELSQIQSTLERSNGANVILVGQPGQEKMEVLWNLARKIKQKEFSSSLVKKIPILFSANRFTASINNKDEFEDKLPLIFDEALKAGNIILIIDNLPRLIIQAKQYDLNIVELIEPYLSGIGGRIIALADLEYFHTLIENNKALMSYFETVNTKPLDRSEIIRIIGREALVIEKNYGLIFSYPALLEIAKSADYYFPDGVSSDKARDLLQELAPWATDQDTKYISKEVVQQYISHKTDIPVSGISDLEQEKLLNLENLLMKRVIAQREAVFAISSAIRRSRAGIRNENRPIGSFLFLGPTGVGKTETAKALAEVFFGDEKKMLRLDMSEYQSEEALARLIGSVENNYQGILANMLREQPYGVLLMDEFEKTNKKVLNLFLQILDEGFFTDAFGKKIMARNTIFIATSNAGADKIFEIVNKNENLQDKKDEIISEIVKNDTLKPELINRFDGTILFHPLTKQNLIEIATLMLKKVSKRLNEKGINFNSDSELINFLAENGYNPTFGARPMNRLIQDTVEEHLSNLIIRRELVPGRTVSFKVLDQTGNKNSLKPIVN